MAFSGVHWFWAKLGNDSWPERFHPVVCHLLDVGQVAAAIWATTLRPSMKRRVARQLGCDEATAGAWIAYWVAAHDIGKITPCFQSLSKMGAVSDVVVGSSGESWRL